MRRSSKTLTAAVLAGTALCTAAWAQFGGGGPMAPPAAPQGMPMPTGGGPNVPGGGMPGAGMPMGGAGGSPFSGRLPFANGTVTAVDAAAGTVTLAPMFGGGGSPQTVRVTEAAQITATREGSVQDLKVGDAVQVRGVPTGIAATSITAGAADGGLGPMPGAGMNGMMNGPVGAGRARTGGPLAAFAQASGRITALSPLTVSVAEGVTLTLKISPNAKISRNVPEKIGDLKVGDRVMANGTMGDDGVLAAGRLRVNADTGMGPGGR